MATSQNDHQAAANSARETETTSHYTSEFAAQIAALASEVSVEEQDAIASLPSGSALLVVRRGPGVGSRFLLDSDVTTVGRHTNADIFLDDVTVSRRHTEFLRRGTAFELKDLGSLNGTYFDGARVDSAVLTDGAEVQIGKFRLTFYASRNDLVASASQ
ncbi:FHA domain-containing protein [Marisediminicola sp. LYQ134]|uniref:FHA domain-containing protein n=1 Tax=unclassified Marisediminicola TaxID=2618316 RepID=UPI0039838864